MLHLLLAVCRWTQWLTAASYGWRGQAATRHGWRRCEQGGSHPRCVRLIKAVPLYSCCRRAVRLATCTQRRVKIHQFSWLVRILMPLQVRHVTLPQHEATGPCKARALCQALWDGEEYVLQLDSHMR